MVEEGRRNDDVKNDFSIAFEQKWNSSYQEHPFQLLAKSKYDD